MQTDPHPTNGETSPLPPPSPTLTTSFRHHPPQAGHDTDAVTPSEGSSSSVLRHRTPYAHSHDPSSESSTSNDTVRISIQSPFGDLGGTRSRRKEGWPLSINKTIGSLKEDLIKGNIQGAGTWEKEGMRMVYHGRIVRDNETISEVVGKVDPEHVYVFHLVARRIPVTPLPTSGIIHQNLSEFPLPPQPTTMPSTPMIPSTDTYTNAPINPFAITTNSLALGDTIHYLLFTSRHHLFELLGMIPLKWDEMVPHPSMPQEKAREAIMSVVRTFAAQRENSEQGWQNWEGAFTGDNQDELKKVWDELKRDKMDLEIRNLWMSATHRKMMDGGEQVKVEVDGTTYTLQLPPTSQLTASQLTHLLLYLRITTLLPLLEPIYHQSLIPLPSPTPTTTQPVPALPNTQTQNEVRGGGRVIYRRTFHLRIPFLPLSALPHLFWSALKITAMVWMLTRGMRWNDTRFWIISGVATGWWIIDALGEIGRATRAIRARRQAHAAAGGVDGQAQAQNQNPGQAQNQGGAGAGQQGPDPTAANANANANINGAGNQAQGAPPAQAQDHGQGWNTAAIRRPIGTSWIPRFHLSTDSHQLRIPPSNINNNAELLAPPRNRPSRVQTQFLLPILLWFITLVPEWENIRNRDIRRRERNMRILVGENQRQNQASREDQVEGQGEGQGENENEENRLQQLEANIPGGISEYAKRYYMRVIQRGEGIDWEEEREAQRALGIAEEDRQGGGEGEDDGMRLRML